MINKFPFLFMPLLVEPQPFQDLYVAGRGVHVTLNLCASSIRSSEERSYYLTFSSTLSSILFGLAFSLHSHLPSI